MKKQLAFQERLEQAKNSGVSVADLALWFNRPYHTVRGWLVPRTDRDREGGYEPWGPYRKELLKRMEQLETALTKKEWIKGQYAPRVKRQKILKALRRECDRAISKTRPAA